MVVEHLLVRVWGFVDYLRDLVARLDQGDGWCGVFWERDPGGMRACLAGREVPPWAVVEALLRVVAARYAAATAAAETGRAGALHDAVLGGRDAVPGVRYGFAARVGVMLRERWYAAGRQAALSRGLAGATSRAAAEALRLDLSWAGGAVSRATARCAELRARLALLGRLDRRTSLMGRRGAAHWPSPAATPVRAVGPTPPRGPSRTASRAGAAGAVPGSPGLRRGSGPRPSACRPLSCRPSPCRPPVRAPRAGAGSAGAADRGAGAAGRGVAGDR
ncbi:hypothetical protein SVIOM74S_01076 [Streptomyces violarus]